MEEGRIAAFPDLELALVTEAVARAVMPLSGKAKKEQADQIAVDAMRQMLEQMDLSLRVVIGEGGKDKAPMLYAGERLGKHKDDSRAVVVDLVVDPLECTTNFSKGLADSMSVLLAVEQDHVQYLPGSYMQQLLVPKSAAPLLGKAISLDTPVPDVLRAMADALDRSVSDLVVVVQDRPRHQELIAAIRKEGAGVSLVESGSISAAFEVVAGRSRRTQMLWGIFGAPEALVIAFMARQAGFGFLARMAPHDEKTRQETRELGLEGRTLFASDLVHGKGLLVMSGIHGSSWLPGVERLEFSSKHKYRVHTLFWKDSIPVLLEHIDGELVGIQAL